MKSYQVFSLYITSELDFPQLVEIECKADVNIRFGKVNETAIEKENSKIIVGEIPEIGKFFIYDGKEIIIEPVKGIDNSLLRTVVLGPIFCVLLRQRGLLVLHASCININNKGVAFMGGSGWGKSTLATAFHTKGYNVLTDDVLPIKIEQNQAVVFPSYPQFKLCPDAATSLGQNPQELLPVSTNSFKVAYKLEKGFQHNPIPLLKIYVLDKGKEHKISNLKPQETFLELVRHTRAIKSVSEQEFFAKHLNLCSELVKNVSFSRFTRKPSLADLPKLIELVESDLICSISS